MAEGKRKLYNAAFALNIWAFIFFFTSYASPYWFQSWPRVYSPFKRIGLWEVCFAGLTLPMDAEQRAYHGCWWILASYFDDIRGWVMPEWFVLTQLITTLCLLGFLVSLLLQLVIWGVTGSENQSGTGKKRAPIKMLQLSAVLTVVMAFLMTFTVIMFGLAVYYDRNWMPHPDLNYLSWSYGFAVLSAFFLIFASIAIVKFTMIERQEWREPPSQGNISFTHQVKDSKI